MSVAIVFMVLFLVLGLSMGPLLVAVLSQALSSERAPRVARWSIGVGLAAVYKPVLSFSGGNDLTLKRRQYDEDHDYDYLTYGGITSKVKRYLHDRPDRYHSFYGTPFAFVEEWVGVPVDPRDVDAGRSLRKNREHSRYEHRVVDGESIKESVKAVFERPRGRVGVRLSEVITLYGGSLDAKSLEKLRDFYQNSQSPKDNTSGLLKLMIPVGAFIAVVMMGMFMSGGGGAAAPSPGSDNSTITTGLLLIGMALPTRSDDDGADESDGGDDDDGILEKLKALNWRDVVVAGLGVTVALSVAAVLLLAFPSPVSLLGTALPLGAWCVLFFALGAGLPPVIARWFGRSLGPIGMALGKLYLIIGLLAFRRPVIDYDDGEYQVVEYDESGFDVEPHWYRFAFSRVGVSFVNDEENWPEGTTLETEQVEEIARGGDETFAPPDMVRTDKIAVNSIGGLVPQPDDVDEDSVYVRTDRTTGVLAEAGKDRRLLQAAMEKAKQDYGGGAQPISDKWIVGATVVSIGMGVLVLMWM